MAFGLRTPVGPENQWGPDPPREGAILRGKGRPIVKYRDAVICAKMAEPIDIPFGLWARMGPRNRVLHGVQIPHGKGQFWGKWAPIVKYRDTLRSPAKIAESTVMQLWARCVSSNHEIDGGPDPPREGAILGKGSPIVKYMHFLP